MIGGRFQLKPKILKSSENLLSNQRDQVIEFCGRTGTTELRVLTLINNYANSFKIC